MMIRDSLEKKTLDKTPNFGMVSTDLYECLHEAGLTTLMFSETKRYFIVTGLPVYIDDEAKPGTFIVRSRGEPQESGCILIPGLPPHYTTKETK